MRSRLRHLPEQADQCLGCACENRENLAAQELLFVTDSHGAHGVVAALFIAGTEHGQIVALAREAIGEQRAWCEENGPFKAAVCTRHAPVCAVPAGEAPLLWIDEAGQ